MNEARSIFVILEDNPDRLEIMRGIIESLPGSFDLRHFDDVGKMRSLSRATFARVRLISLDFSLDSSSAPTPGTGMDAVQFLIQRDPVCPVIVHTSSSGDARKMTAALTEQGWTVRQVSFGSSDRVEKWRAAVVELLGLVDGKARDARNATEK